LELTYFGRLAGWDLRAWFPSIAIGRTVGGGRSTGSRWRTGVTQRSEESYDLRL